MPTAPTPVTAAPTAPDRADRSTFNSRATAWADYQKVNLVPEINALADNVYDNAVEAVNSASNAATSEANAADSEAIAAAAAQTAVNAPGTSATSTASLTIGTGSKTLTIQAGKSLVVGMSVKVAATATPTNWMFGDITAYDSVSGSLTVNVTSTNGSVTASAWTISLAGQRGPAGPDGQPAITTRSARTANTMLVAADKGKFIDITSGTFTQTFDTCAALGDGWAVWIRNAGTGDITLDPSGAEIIDGLASYVMYPCEARLIQCDGTTLRSLVVQPFYKVFATTANFIKPPGYSYFGGLNWAAGGSGAACGSVTYNASGGAGGACVPFTIPAANFAASEIVTIGAGGAAVSSSTTAVGLTGGSSSIGSLVTAYPGGGGYAASAATIAGGSGGGMSGPGNNGSSGTPSGGLPNDGPTFGGASGGGGGNNSSVYGGGSGGGASGSGASDGGSSVFGGAGGAGIWNAAKAGGTSRYGGNGGASSISGPASAGSIPGGGGGAASGGFSSGAGGRGEVRIWGIA